MRSRKIELTMSVVERVDCGPKKLSTVPPKVWQRYCIIPHRYLPKSLRSCLKNNVITGVLQGLQGRANSDIFCSIFVFVRVNASVLVYKGTHMLQHIWFCEPKWPNANGGLIPNILHRVWCFEAHIEDTLLDTWKNMCLVNPDYQHFDCWQQKILIGTSCQSLIS